MFFKYTAQKAIGFSFLDDDIVRYALIQQTQNKILIEQTVEFNIHCKSALHRLQQLLKKYPSCLSFNSKNCLLYTTNGDIKSRKDQQEIIKNKADSLIAPDRTFTVQLGELNEKHPSFLCSRQSFLKNLKNKLEFLTLSPQKIISSLQAILSLQKKISLFDDYQALMIVSNQKIELIQFSGKCPTSFACISLSDLNFEQINTKVHQAVFELFKNNSLNLYIYGQSIFLKELKTLLEKISSLKILPLPKEAWLNEHPEYLLEIGSALSLFDLACHGFEPIKFKNIIKIFHKQLIVHTISLIAIAFASNLFWGMQIREQKNLYQKMFSQSYSKLSKEAPKTSYNTLELLEKLQQQQIESPKMLLTPNTMNISDCLAWLSNIVLKISKNTNTSPILFEDFKYNLINMDPKGALTFLNQAKVNISLTAANSSIARDFYEEISKAKEIVDLTKKIQWEFHNNSYHIAFFLKPKKEVLND